MTEQAKVLCFTVKASGGLLVVLETSVGISASFVPTAGMPAPEIKQFRAIWDTGATATAITQKVVDECGLKPTGIAQVQTANGLHTTETYLVAVVLPNSAGFTSVQVSRGDIAGTDVLIGMDIISQGDFAVTNAGGETMFSYRHPSQKHIDFVKMHPQLQVLGSDGFSDRNKRRKAKKDARKNR